MSSLNVKMKTTVKLEPQEKVKPFNSVGLDWIALCGFPPNPVICIQRPHHSGMHCRQAQPESYTSTSLAIAVFSVPQLFSLLFFFFPFLYYYLMVEFQNSDFADWALTDLAVILLSSHIEKLKSRQGSGVWRKFGTTAPHYWVKTKKKEIVVK